MVVSRSLDVVDEYLVDLSNVRSDQSDLSHFQSLESLQCSGERGSFVGVLLQFINSHNTLALLKPHLSLRQLSEYLLPPDGGRGRGAAVGQNVQP